MVKRVLVILAPGFEEVEAFTPVDILRRAGADVVVAGTVDGIIVGRNDIKVLADESLSKAASEEYDMVVLPGGAVGTENLMSDSRVKNLLERQHGEGKFIAAICAAPVVLSSLGISAGKNITAHPSVKVELIHEKYNEKSVVVDGNIITGRSAGTSMKFAFTLVEIMFGKGQVDKVNSGVMAKI